MAERLKIRRFGVVGRCSNVELWHNSTFREGATSRCVFTPHARLPVQTGDGGTEDMSKHIYESRVSSIGEYRTHAPFPHIVLIHHIAFLFCENGPQSPARLTPTRELLDLPTAV